jgi:hypothetical protein
MDGQESDSVAGQPNDAAKLLPSRPLIITLLGWMLIALGALEFAVHAVKIRWPAAAGDVGVALFELVILGCGVFLLRGSNVARWAATAWIGFHIVVGSLNSPWRGVLHGLIFLLFAWMVFRPEVNAWFRAQRRAAG